jgi:hypothetical protein
LGPFFLSINSCMASYNLQASAQSTHTPSKLTRGRVRIWSTVPIYWVIGENPVARSSGCARLSAGQVLELRLPTSCARLAVLAVDKPGSVTVTEVPGGASSSCSL